MAVREVWLRVVLTWELIAGPPSLRAQTPPQVTPHSLSASFQQPALWNKPPTHLSLPFGALEAP